MVSLWKDLLAVQCVSIPHMFSSARVMFFSYKFMCFLMMLPGKQFGLLNLESGYLGFESWIYH